jgi:translation initiation factor IF-3
MGHPDAEPKLIGRNIHVMLTPLPSNKRKAKFHVKDGEGEDETAPSTSQAAEV